MVDVDVSCHVRLVNVCGVVWANYALGLGLGLGLELKC